MMENKKNNFWLGILIGVLVTLVIGMGVFIVYDKVLSDNNENASNGSNEEGTELSVDSGLVQELYQISGGNIDGTQTKGFITALYGKEETIISDLSIEYKDILMDFSFTGSWVEYSKYPNYGDIWLYISRSELEKEWEKVFGADAEYELVNTTIGCNHYTEDGSLYWTQEIMEEATLDSDNCGGAALPEINIELIKAIESNDEIILYEAIKFLSYDDDDNAKYYSNIEKTNKVTENAYIPANYKKIFKRDSLGNYYFYSIEKIK